MNFQFLATKLLSNVLYVCAVHHFLNRFFQRLRVSRWILWSAYGVFYALLGGINFIQCGLLLNILFNVISFFLIGLLYEGDFFKRLLAAFFMYSMVIAVEDNICLLISLLFHIPLADALSQSLYLLPGVIISQLLLLALVYGAGRLFKNFNDSDLPRRYWLATFLIPVCSVFIMHSLVQFKLSASNNFSTVEFTCITLLCINILTLYLYNNLLIEERVKRDNLVLASMNKYYEGQIALVQDFQKSIRVLRHDMQNHFLALKGLADEHQYEGIVNYLDDLFGVTETAKMVTSGNFIVDAIVNSKLYTAEQLHIKVEGKYILPEQLSMNQMDMTILLGNLLDNAIEACAKIPEERRYIYVKMTYWHEALELVVENPYMGNLLEKNGFLQTTKSGGSDEHGLGLLSVERVVRKYHGDFLRTHTPDGAQGDGVFKVDILLYTNANAECIV